MREGRSSILFFDNVRGRVESALLEQSALSPLLSFRLLGHNATLSRPNSCLWVLTSNQTSATEDFVSRGLPIRLYYEGNPKSRTFAGDPVGLAGERRCEVLGELAAMVLRWVQQGKPLAARQHRCRRWAAVVGGVLQANGLGEPFLANAAEAEGAMDEGVEALAALAEHVVTRGLAACYLSPGEDAAGKGQPAGDWQKYAADAQLFRDRLAGKTPRSQTTWIGTFLSARANRTVEISVPTGVGIATLRMRPWRSNQKLYFFEVDVASGQENLPATAGTAPSPGAGAEAAPVLAPAADVAAAPADATSNNPQPAEPAADAGSTGPTPEEPQWL
jgi:hypothetical protein